jgi:exosome complex component MTR3
VYGPRPVQSREGYSDKCRIYCEFKYATFASRTRTQHQRSDGERELSSALVDALSSSVCLDQYPKSSIDIYVMVYEMDGWASTFSAGVMCASLAMADAGIEMLDLVACSNMAYYSEADTVVVDPNQEDEAKDGVGYMILASMPSLGSITHIIQQGDLDASHFDSHMSKLMDINSQLYQAMSRCLTLSAEQYRSRKRKLLQA